MRPTKLTFITLLPALLLSWSAAAGGAHILIDEVRACRSEKDSLKRLTCFDAIDLEGVKADAVSEGRTGNPPTPETHATTAVEFVSADIRRQAKNYEKDIYNDRIELVPTFRNKTSKTVVAVAITLAITDAFGETIVSQPGKLDIRIPPSQTVQSDVFYFWADNTFLPNDAYDKLVGPVSLGTAKPALAVTKVIYSDGSAEDF